MPEPHGPNWRECMAARAECQSGIYRKLDEQHRETLTKVGEIREIIAEQRGRATADTGRREPVEPVEARGILREVLIPVLAAVLTSAVMGGLYAWFAHGGGAP